MDFQFGFVISVFSVTRWLQKRCRRGGTDMNLTDTFDRSNSPHSVAATAQSIDSANSLLDRLADDLKSAKCSPPGKRVPRGWRKNGSTVIRKWKPSPSWPCPVIYEELCLREEHGESVDLDELRRRFPQFREALSLLLSCHRLMNSDAAVFPTAGEQLGEFHLLREFGRGGLGRVFLATQPSLSDRPLVVKLTPQAGDEHLSLARLQHSHIVPLFLVQDFPERNLRTLCMPFLGGASWSSILQELNSCGKADRNGTNRSGDRNGATRAFARRIQRARRSAF